MISHVVTAPDGPAGLRAAMTGSFDAVLLDIMLPGLSGYRVLQQLRAAGVGTPVLLVSAKDGEIDQADGHRNRDTGGTGLGLALVADTVRRYGGTARVGDAPDGGARFEVRWPVGGSSRIPT